ncbi:Gfo/Idh/MocA family protein [Metabacillus niabensis]|uniref:Gfo/Idh/MocA family protein n=1 Tax=Metabacillus niabensis TaxID=324854 RepID=UPI001CFAEE8D|nr:Gfo/Idh/MocA family oxidoreductase [Metabacillus niabensis]
MNEIKVGVIGIGNMGSSHVLLFDKGKISGAKVTAVCDDSKQILQWLKENTINDIAVFQDVELFFKEADIDAVIIATPHYTHPELAIKGLKCQKHILVEKPAGVYTKNVAEVNQTAKDTGLVYSMVYNQRTNPLYQKVRELIQTGQLGSIKRTNWIITDWYRTQSYYNSSDWRATWKGEGGGVILNQAPHQLDLWQWTTDLMPTKVRAYCHIGKYHDIEVEDDVTAYVEYENGATGIFITSTGEAPGSNRFEIVGDRGKLIVENEKLTFYKLSHSEREFNAAFKGGFGKPECEKVDIPVRNESSGHMNIIQNWIDAIVKGTPLLAPGEEGIKALEIANAIYLSCWLNEDVQLPIDADLYYEKLQERIQRLAL